MRKFFKTVAIVTVFSTSEKFLGFLYRIFLSRTIGSEGMGLYQVALSVFAVLLTVSCSGTPITVSRLMTKYRADGKTAQAHKAVTAGIAVTLCIAIPLFLVMFFGNGLFSFLFADPRCSNVFLIVLPGLIFTSVYAVLRGVFWGNKDFLPYSIIELLEEICMIVVGIILVTYAANVYDGALRAGFAVLISYLFSFTLATAVFFIRGGKLKNPKTEFKPLIAAAAPVTAMRTANSLAISLISVILPIRLMACGMTSSQAMSALGSAFGMAIPLLFIPTTLIGSFTLVLVPEIAEHFYRGNHLNLKRDIEKAIKFAVFLSCLFIPPFFVFGKELGVLIFDSVEGGKYLSASAFLMLFMSLSNLSTSMLNSVGQETKSLAYFIVGAAFMLLCIWFLPQFLGIYALLAGFTFVFGLTTILNLRLLSQKCLNKPQYLKFVICSIAFLIPVSVLGFLLKGIFTNLLGNLFTLLACSGIMAASGAALYPVFSLADVNIVLSAIKKTKPRQQRKA